MDVEMDNEDERMNSLDGTKNNLETITCELVVEADEICDGDNEDEDLHNLDVMMDYELVEELDGSVELIVDCGMDDDIYKQVDGTEEMVQVIEEDAHSTT